MKVLIVNVVLGYGSTGRIALNIAKELEQLGNEVKIAYSRDPIPEDGQKYAVKIGDKLDTYRHAAYTRLTDKHGLASEKVTKDFLAWADEYNPDLLWLHNIHGYYINYEILFDWIKSRPDMKVKWTLHDCWTFTGHCAYFSYAKCNKWESIEEDSIGCNNCPQYKAYPKSMHDNSVDNYARKKKAFTGVNDLTIITPSNWLRDMVKLSFLKEYPVEVVPNKIDTNIFKPSPSKFKEERGISDRNIILGVANTWEPRKGTEDFIRLADKLPSDWVIVLVGKNERKKFPDNVILIERTNSKEELAAIYTAADVYVNASYEETFGMTTIEALACGTPVIVYNKTAVPEVVEDGCGIIIEPSTKNIIDNLDKAMHIPSEKCIANAEKYKLDEDTVCNK